ncbi:hypothetical protein JCM10207_005842 [Rhodosporidiobolus poonsookiae]
MSRYAPSPFARPLSSHSSSHSSSHPLPPSSRHSTGDRAAALAARLDRARDAFLALDLASAASASKEGAAFAELATTVVEGKVREVEDAVALVSTAQAAGGAEEREREAVPPPGPGRDARPRAAEQSDDDAPPAPVAHRRPPSSTASKSAGSDRGGAPFGRRERASYADEEPPFAEHQRDPKEEEAEEETTPLPGSRAPSRRASVAASLSATSPTSDAPLPPASTGSVTSSFSRLFKRAPGAAASARDNALSPPSPSTGEDGQRRPSSRASEKSGRSKSRREERDRERERERGEERFPPPSSSRRHDRERERDDPYSRSYRPSGNLSDLSDGERAPPPPPSKHKSKSKSRAGSRHRSAYASPSEEGDEVPSRSADTRARSRSIVGGGGDAPPPSRSRSGRALDLASAPPPPPPAQEDKEPEPLRLQGGKVARAIAQAADTATLLVLARVSKEYGEAAMKVLYGSVAVSSLRQVEKLDHTLEANRFLAGLVQSLRISPLDAGSSAPAADKLVPPVARLVSRLPNLLHLDEDLTTGDLDVTTLVHPGSYILSVSPSAPKKLRTFRSARAWFEIGALAQLLASQPDLETLDLGGAAMDRDWEGGKLLSSLGVVGASAPAKSLRTLCIKEVMHEDTLAVLLRSAPALTSLEVGFQSIGSTDDDTPRASIPAALARVAASLTSLKLSAPSKGSDDTTGLLDECVAALPALRHVAFDESTDLVPAPLGSSRTLSALPKTLESLRGRNVVSVSTGKVLALLDEPEGVPQLREIDLKWARGTEEDGEPWFRERHLKRIEEACEELGIRCRVRRAEA